MAERDPAAIRVDVVPAILEPRVAEICRANDVLLIADEVITGFGQAIAAVVERL